MIESSAYPTVEESALHPYVMADAPPAIILDSVRVAFRSYHERASSVKESVLRILKRKSIETFETFDALSDVSIAIPQGSVLGIIGSNGSGKSTLLKVLAQVLRPVSGRVIVNGRVASLIELGVAFDPELNAIENIFLHASLHKKGRAEIKERIPEILEFAELTEVATRPVKHYSSGMIARLGFSCAVDVDPDILLVDEILGVGDERFQKKCSKVFDRFFAARKTIVIVGHNLETLAEMSSQILLLSQGRVAYMGDPATAVQMYRDKSYRTFLKPESSVVEEPPPPVPVAPLPPDPATRFTLCGEPLERFRINIVTEPAPGWVLRRISQSFARELGSAAHVTTEADPDADVNFYVNYALFSANTRCDVGFFTYRQSSGHWADVFDRVKEQAHFCVSMCRKTARLLPEANTDIVLIPPDQTFIKGRLILGVVAHDYESALKRFEGLREIRDLPGVEIKISGGNLSGEEFPGFYESIDYLLVLGDSDGGRIPLVEALGLGVPVIAPDVGFVEEYTTIRYETIEDLKSIISRLLIPTDAWFQATQALVHCFEKALAISAGTRALPSVGAKG